MRNENKYDEIVEFERVYKTLNYEAWTVTFEKWLPLMLIKVS